MSSSNFPIRRLGASDHHHFFGYYNKTPWDKSGRCVLAQRVPMMNARLTPQLSAEIGYFDLHDGDRFHVVGSTTAWNWQMGSQLQWLDGAARRKLIFNSRSADTAARYPGFGSTIVDIDSGEHTALPLPVWPIVFGGALLAWALIEGIAQLAWRGHEAPEGPS